MITIRISQNKNNYNNNNNSMLERFASNKEDPSRINGH